jgi:DNA-binding transcriptional ArsR family regulator
MNELKEPPVIDVELIPQVASRFRALSDPGRLSLLATLQRGERSVGALAEATGRTQPNVSQHLASLQKAGLVVARREGNRVFYRIADPTVMRICEAVCDSLVARARAARRQMAAVESRRRRRAGGGE